MPITTNRKALLPMTATPISLLERLRQPNEHEAWSRFVALYTPLVYTWARRVGLQESDAADLVQDVFTVLLEKMPHFVYDRQGSFRAWLKTVTLNQWRAQCRRVAARRETGGEAPDLAVSGELEAFWESESQQYVVGQALRVMQTDFEPQTWQMCWELVVEGQPAAQVARKWHVRVGTVYAARCRVLARLRQELAGLED
jgi:RNA polymerase sigma-70 factor, ECF subfamily